MLGAMDPLTDRPFLAERWLLGSEPGCQRRCRCYPRGPVAAILAITGIVGALIMLSSGYSQHIFVRHTTVTEAAAAGIAPSRMIGRWSRVSDNKLRFLPSRRSAELRADANPLTARPVAAAQEVAAIDDPEVLRDQKHKFRLEAPSIFKPYIGDGYRETKMYTIVDDVMWGFEQSQELASLSVNIRCTVIRLKSGGLWVHSPVFPTPEFLAQLADLGGDVQHIVLPTYALEHRLPMAPFIRRMRDRARGGGRPMPEVWSVSDAWSFPVDLPLAWLGIPVNGVIGQDKLPWADELDFKILRIADVGNPFIEAAFFHKASKTLIVTDTVYEVSRTPPDVTPVSLLLDVAPDDPAKPLPDTPATRQQAWAKMALLIAFFIPARQRLVKGGKAEWQEGYMDSFEALTGRLLVSPILQTLVFEKSRPVVRDWVEAVTKWPFVQVVPAHYAAPVGATPQDFRQAYGFAFDNMTDAPLPQEDMRTLNDLKDIIRSLSSSDGSTEVYGRLFDKFFKNLFIEKPGWLK